MATYRTSTEEDSSGVISSVAVRGRLRRRLEAPEIALVAAADPSPRRRGAPLIRTNSGENSAVVTLSFQRAPQQGHRLNDASEYRGYLTSSEGAIGAERRWVSSVHSGYGFVDGLSKLNERHLNFC
jgi:hypothetical protein